MAIISTRPQNNSVLSWHAAFSGKSAPTLKTILKKQSQFPECQTNVSATLTKVYIIYIASGGQKNKANLSAFGRKSEALSSKSETRTLDRVHLKKQSQFRSRKNNVTSCGARYYEKSQPFGSQENKAKQSQFSSVQRSADSVRISKRHLKKQSQFSRGQVNLKSCRTRNYVALAASGLLKNKPKQSQFQNPVSG